MASVVILLVCVAAVVVIPLPPSSSSNLSARSRSRSNFIICSSNNGSSNFNSTCSSRSSTKNYFCSSSRNDRVNTRFINTTGPVYANHSRWIRFAKFKKAEVTAVLPAAPTPRKKNSICGPACKTSRMSVVSNDHHMTIYPRPYPDAPYRMQHFTPTPCMSQIRGHVSTTHIAVFFSLAADSAATRSGTDAAPLPSN